MGPGNMDGGSAAVEEGEFLDHRDVAHRASPANVNANYGLGWILSGDVIQFFSESPHVARIIRSIVLPAMNEGDDYCIIILRSLLGILDHGHHFVELPAIVEFAKIIYFNKA